MEADLPQSPSLDPQPFEFTGSGGDYFRIWIVNIALTVVTLGIYSAWAKVRRLQYFYRNTRVAGSSFDYHGRPVAILKGRLIAFALLAAYSAAEKVDLRLALAIAIPIVLALPWMLRQSLRFRLHYSSWRGLRFTFWGTLRGAYAVFLLWPLLTLVTVFALGPLWHQRLKRYQHGGSAFGRTPFRFDASPRKFYGIYVEVIMLVGALVLVVGGLVSVASVLGSADRTAGVVAPFVIAAFGIIGFIGYSAVVGPYRLGRIQNLVWNSTTLGPHRFESRLKFGRLAWITLSNLALVVLTLGLFMPFAAVRMTRYRLSCMTLLPASSLEEFVAGEQASVAAVGEELGEFLDIDIAL